MNHALLELQELENGILALAREKSKLNDGSAARAELAALQSQLGTETAVQQKIHADRTDRELQLKMAEEKLKKQGSRLMNANSTHEVTALQRDIESLGRARGDLDEAILTLMDEGDQAAARILKINGLLDAKRRELTEIEAHYAAEVKRIAAAAAAKQKLRLEVTAKLKPNEVATFTSYAKAHGGIALAKVIKGNCSTCGTALTPYTLKEAKTQEFPICEGCGRLIFVE